MVKFTPLILTQPCHTKQVCCVHCIIVCLKACTYVSMLPFINRNLSKANKPYLLLYKVHDVFEVQVIIVVHYAFTDVLVK